MKVYSRLIPSCASCPDFDESDCDDYMCCATGLKIISKGLAENVDLIVVPGWCPLPDKKEI